MGSERILVVYPYLQHYRYGVFREMDRTADVEYVFVSDVRGKRGIEPLGPESVARHISTPRRQLGPLMWQRGLLTILSKEKFDAVIIFAEIPALSTWLGALLARLRGKPVYFWTTGWHRPESGLKRVFRNIFYHLSTKLLLYGNIGKSIGNQMGFPNEKMEVIGNSVESPTPLSINASQNWAFSKPTGTIVLGAVIRLISPKKLEQLIRAVSVLNEEEDLPPISVLIVGEGPERSNLEALAREIRVDLVMPGAFYDRSSIESVYEVLDLTVVPGAVGLTAIQSMAYGVPVITNGEIYAQGPEWEAIKDGETGWLFEENDLADLVSKIRAYISLSTEEKKEISQNCKEEHKLNWAAESQAKKIIEIIRQDLDA